MPDCVFSSIPYILPSPVCPASIHTAVIKSNFHFQWDRGELHFKKLFTWYFIPHCWWGLWILIEAGLESDKHTQKATAGRQHACGIGRALLMCVIVLMYYVLRCVHVNKWSDMPQSDIPEKRRKIKTQCFSECSTNTGAKAHKLAVN